MKETAGSVAVISFPMGSRKSVGVLLRSLLDILDSVCDDIYVISGDAGPFRLRRATVVTKRLRGALTPSQSTRPGALGVFAQCAKIVAISLEMGACVLWAARRHRVMLFYVGGPLLLFPLAIARVLGVRTALFSLGRASIAYERTNGSSLTVRFVSLLERAVFRLANCIVVESEGAIQSLSLCEYRDKTISLGARYIDLDKFRVVKAYDSRRRVVGYLGRLESSKGVHSLLQAIPIVTTARNDISFVLAGEGPLRDGYVNTSSCDDTSSSVSFCGWIDNDDVPAFLNELRLLVLPSCSEGLPTVVLESMACGTPVLATRVGGMTDLLKDGETGFLIDCASPENIAANIVRAISCPDIERVGVAARSIVESKFSYRDAVERYSRILDFVLTSSRRE